MNREQLDIALEWVISLILLIATIYGILALGAVRPIDQVVIALFIGAAAFLWVIRLVLVRKERILWPHISTFLLIFIGYTLFRYWQAEVEYVARKELWRVVLYSCIFLLTINNLYRQAIIRFFVLALCFLAAIEAIYAIYQFVQGYDKVLWYTRPINYHGRGSGTYICPNHLAGFLELVLPLAFSLGIIGRLTDLGRVIILYISFAIIAGIFSTLSRGGWLVTIMILFFIGRLLYRRIWIGWKGWIVIGILTIIVLFGLIKLVNVYKYKITPRIEEIASPGKPSEALVRWHLSKATFQMWVDHFLLGVGPAHFDVRWPGYRPVQVQNRPIWAHNDWLQLPAEYGLIGLGIIIGGIWCLVVSYRKTWKLLSAENAGFVSKHSNRGSFVFGCGLSLLAIALHSFFDFNLHIPANAILTVIISGILVTHERFTTRQVWISSRSPIHYLVAILILIGGGWLLMEARTTYREASLFEKAKNAQHAEDQLSMLVKVWQIEDKNPAIPIAIGEIYRLESWVGGSGWNWLAEEAIKWFEKARQLNRWDPYPWVRIGMCLDWLGRLEDAEPYFDKAVELDPNNHYIAILRGWHEMQKGNWENAMNWFKRSLELKSWENWTAHMYLRIAEKKIAEK